jgi:hypothetical protein
MDEVHVLARGVLLDALEALRPHRDAITLAGAQAVYARVGDAGIAVAPTTTDADLGLDPVLLADRPPLDALLRRAGFERKRSEGGEALVGIWTRTTDAPPVSVDLLTPESLAPAGGRRAARLPGHETGTVLKVPGIEATLVDADVMSVSALESSDRRSFDLRVAGPAALLVAKVHKILDRADDAGRLNDKDALDVFRLLRGCDPHDLVARLRIVLDDPRSSPASHQAVDVLSDLLGRREGEGVVMVVRATEGLMVKEEVEESMVALVRELIDLYRERRT